MKLEPQITNNQSSLIDNQSKRHSFNYNIFPDTPFYAKQSQFPQNQNDRKLIYHRGL